jgi:RNA-directed DNA polymerase
VIKAISARKLEHLRIRDIRHLCLLLHTKQTELDSICQGISTNPDNYYIRGTFKDKKGKLRPKATPKGRFRAINNNLNALLQRLLFPANMHGGLRGHTTLSYAKPHIRKSCVIKLDIKDFFPSINHTRVYKAFCALRCTPDVARYLTRLTTIDNQLPQGSPTSAIVANIVTKPFAKRLNGLANSINGESGTYVDDLILSGRGFVDKLQPTLKKIVRQEGLIINEKKTIVFKKRNPHIITGIRVDKGLDIPKEKILEIRKLIEDILIDRCEGKYIERKRISSIEGKIRYVKRLNKGTAGFLSQQLKKAL